MVLQLHPSGQLHYFFGLEKMSEKEANSCCVSEKWKNM